MTLPIFPTFESSVQACNNTIIKDTICKDNLFTDLNKIENSTLYSDGSNTFTGSSDKSNINSKIYITGDLKTNNLNGYHKGLSFYTSGKATFSNLDGRGLLVQSKGNIEFNSIIN